MAASVRERTHRNHAMTYLTAHAKNINGARTARTARINLLVLCML
jgi:hypothetical protein